MKSRILIDCDGVLADYTSAALKVINKELKFKGDERFETSHVQHWDICLAVGHPELTDTVRNAASKKGFCLKIKVYSDAEKAVTMLQSLGELFIVTAPFNIPNWTFERNAWLQEHFDIERSHIIHTDAKHVCSGDIFIDDKPENVEKWAEHNPEGLGMLWHQLYNTNYKWNASNIVRVSSWEIVKDMIEARQQQRLCEGHGQ